jgi:hypothetical protein
MKFRADSPELERLSNKLLDAAFEPSVGDIAAMGGKLSPEGLAEIGGERRAKKLRDIGEKERQQEESATQKWVAARLAHGRIVVAIENGDIDAALALAGSNLKLLQLVTRVLVYKRRPGEQKRRPRDYSPMLRTVLRDLWTEVDLLRQLWKKNGIKVVTGRTETGPKPAARDIVLRRAGAVDLKAKMDSFDKNHSRCRR